MILNKLDLIKKKISQIRCAMCLFLCALPVQTAAAAAGAAERVLSSAEDSIGDLKLMLAKRLTASGRRPKILRSAASYGAVRCREPKRFAKGIEAAALFELPDIERNIQRHEIEEKQPGFAARHKGLLIAACAAIVLLGAGYFGLNHLYNSKSMFVKDEETAGNITITERLTTGSELSEKVSYFLVAGADYDDGSVRTDCIWIMCFDNAAHDITVMQVPRDTYVGSASASGKINAVAQRRKSVKYCEKCDYAPDENEITDSGRHTVCRTKLVEVKESSVSALIRYINEHLGLPIDHFVLFDFQGFAKVVDTMGGVDITLERGIHDKAITLGAGTHHLTGWQAVDYMRHRKSYLEGDLGRVAGQRILINALMQKALDMDVTQMLSIVTKCTPYFQTDLSLAELKDYAIAGRNVKVEDLEMFTMPGEDYWPNHQGQSYYICNENSTIEMINAKLLPYGLPGGGLATEDTVSFPKVSGKAVYTGKETNSTGTQSNYEPTAHERTTTRYTEAEPTEPEPTEPEPTETQPIETEPTEPKPTEPKPTEPKPTEPKPTEPKPTEPKPTEPKPTEPKPTEPKPTEPQPTEPVAPAQYTPLSDPRG